MSGQRTVGVPLMSMALVVRVLLVPTSTAMDASDESRHSISGAVLSAMQGRDQKTGWRQRSSAWCTSPHGAMHSLLSF